MAEADIAFDELRERLNDPYWRITSGRLYKIITKGDGPEESLFVPFIPNAAQLALLNDLGNRNLILKARQLGFTTLIAILWLDTALFSKDPIRCAIVAQDREAAESIFALKVRRAYDALPAELRMMMPLRRDSATELVFAHNGSSIKVATSVRSGTIHRLHISEFGKICAKYPDKAAEVVTGSIPAVPLSGILIIESTAEGREGEFFDITQRAIAIKQARKALTNRDYRFHFFPWFEAAEYRMDPASVLITDKDTEYFESIEAKTGATIGEDQRAWYIATRNSDYPSKPERMWQEYPSTPEEAFQKSTEGTYYVNELALARKQGRITIVPFEKATPVNTFWDIGLNDEMAIWFHQRIGAQNRFIRYYENSGETFSHYVSYMQALGYVWGRHYLPHDGDTKRLGTVQNWTPKQMLEDLGLRNIEIVDRIDRIQTGIQMVRDVFGSCWFDEKDCQQGLIHLENYRKEWDARLGVWKDEPRHDKASNGADALRGFAQGYEAGTSGTWKRRKSSWRTA